MKFFAELMEFHPYAAILLIEMTCLIVVILFSVIFQKIFKKISGKLLLCFFAFSRLTDALSTILAFKKLPDYNTETNFLLRHWLLNKGHLPDLMVILLYTLAIFFLIYFLYKFCWNYSRFMRSTIKVLLLTISATGMFCVISNFLNL